MVEAFMMPCYDRIAEFARAHGVRIVSVDTDGDCSELVPVMMRHGINMFFPFEVQAGNDILEYQRKYPALGIMGGLDKRTLAANRKAIDVEVERAAAAIRRGRYVPGFDHLIPPDASWENMQYAAERIRKVCGAG
jgi:uroporphyrinogen decarboxylase